MSFIRSTIEQLFGSRNAETKHKNASFETSGYLSGNPDQFHGDVGSSVDNLFSPAHNTQKRRGLSNQLPSPIRERSLSGYSITGNGGPSMQHAASATALGDRDFLLNSSRNQDDHSHCDDDEKRDFTGSETELKKVIPRRDEGQNALSMIDLRRTDITWHNSNNSNGSEFQPGSTVNLRSETTTVEQYFTVNIHEAKTVSVGEFHSPSADKDEKGFTPLKQQKSKLAENLHDVPTRRDGLSEEHDDDQDIIYRRQDEEPESQSNSHSEYHEAAANTSNRMSEPLQREKKIPKVDKNLQVIIDRTKTQLRSNATKTVETSASAGILKRLRGQEGERMIIVIGDKHSAKTTIGFQLLAGLSDEWIPMALHDYDEWKIVAPFINNNKKKCAIFIDDILTKTDLENSRMWSPVFRDIYASASMRKLVLIASLERSLHEQFQDRSYGDNDDFQNLFARRFIADLSKQYSLTFEDREAILCKKLESAKVYQCELKQDETLGMLTHENKGCRKRLISKDTIRQIASTDISIFPWNAHRFVDSLENLNKGASLFQYPPKFMCDELKDCRKSQSHTDIAKFLSLSRAFDDASTSEHTGTSIKGRKSWFKKKNKNKTYRSEPMLHKIVKEKRIDSVDRYIQHGTKYLRDTLLTLDEESQTMMFKAEPVVHATALMLADDGRELDVIKAAPEVVVQKLVRLHTTTTSLDEIHGRIIATYPATHVALVKRLVGFGLDGHIQVITNHEAMSDIQFAQLFLKQCSKKTVMKDLLVKKDSSSNRTIFFHGLSCSFTASKDKTHNLTELLLSKGYKPEDTDRKHILERCCKEGIETTFFALANKHIKVTNEDTECLSLTCKSSSHRILENLAARQTLVHFIQMKALKEVCLAHSLERPTLCRKLCGILKLKGAFFSASGSEMSIAHEAIDRGNLNLLEIAHEFGADLDDINKEQETPLLLACTKGQTACAKYLIDNDVNLSLPSLSGNAPVHEAAKLNRKKTLKMILDRDANAGVKPTSNGWMPIHIAAKYNNDEVIELVLTYGCNIDVLVTGSHETSLHIAVRHNSKQCIEVLLSKGAKDNEIDSKGRKPFFIAFEMGTHHILNPLFKKYGYLGMCDIDNLFFAVQENQPELVGQLIAEGYCGVNDTNTRGQTPLTFAIQRAEGEIVEQLIKKGGDVNLLSSDGLPLQVAVEHERTDIVNVLLATGAKVLERVGNNQDTYLHLACRRRQPDIVNALLAYLPTALIDDKNKEGKTALHEAVECGCAETVELLLKWGAQKCYFTKAKSESPMDIALRRKKEENIKVRDMRLVWEFDRICQMLR